MAPTSGSSVRLHEEAKVENERNGLSKLAAASDIDSTLATTRSIPPVDHTKRKGINQNKE